MFGLLVVIVIVNICTYAIDDGGIDLDTYESSR